jgi:hypothetical protein
MKDTFAAVKPIDIVEVYVAGGDGKPKEIADALWSRFGADTIKVIAAGSDCLARLWQGAWAAGNGGKKITDLGAIDAATLAEIYQPFDFLQSKSLDTIAPVLATGNGGADGAVRHARTLSGARTPRRRRTPGSRS